MRSGFRTHPKSRRFGQFAIGIRAVVLGASVSSASAAQSSTLIGIVTSDSAHKHTLDGVLVSIPALNRSVRTAGDGTYVIDSLKLGRYLVTVRAIGFVIAQDSVTIDVADGTLHDFVLSRAVQPLAPVVTTAPKREYVSPQLRAFEDRRAQGFGRFISEDELRKTDNSRLSDVMLAHLAGARLVHSTRGTFLTSTRTTKNGDRVLKQSGASGCYATVYLDGAILYDQQSAERFKSTPGAQPIPPNLDDYGVSQLAGVEYYAGEATSPMGYKHSGCGLLLLWTRER